MCLWVDQGSKGSRAVPAGSQGVKGYAFRFTGGEVVGLQVLNNIENYWPLLNAWTLLNTFEHYLRLLNKIEHLWVLLDWAILSCTWLYWAVLGGAGLYWVILGCTELYWAVLNSTVLHWALLGWTGPPWAVLGATGLYWTELCWAVLGSSAQCVLCKVRCHCIFSGPVTRYSDIFCVPGIRYSVIIKLPCALLQTGHLETVH